MIQENRNVFFKNMILAFVKFIAMKNIYYRERNTRTVWDSNFHCKYILFAFSCIKIKRRDWNAINHTELKRMILDFDSSVNLKIEKTMTKQQGV